MNGYAKYSIAKGMIDEENKPKILLKVYETILEKLDNTKKYIEIKDYEKKYLELSKITTAIEILDASLDTSLGEISTNLSSIYQYIIRRLNEVHRTFDKNTIDECKNLIKNIYDGFLRAYEQEKRPNHIIKNEINSSSVSQKSITI